MLDVAKNNTQSQTITFMQINDTPTFFTLSENLPVIWRVHHFSAASADATHRIHRVMTSVQVVDFRHFSVHADDSEDQ